MEENKDLQDLETLNSAIDKINAEQVADVEGNENLPAPEPSDYEKDLKDLEAFINVPFVEIITQFNQMKRSYEDLKSSKEMMDQLGMAGDPLAAKTAQGNFLDTATTFSGKSADEFYAQYPTLIHECERITNMLKKIIELYGTEVQSTQFMSDSMAESGLNQMKSLESRKERHQNHDFLMKRSKNIVEAYSDRTNFEPIFVKLSFANNIIECYKTFAKDGPDQAMKVVNTIFQNIFNDEFASRFRKCLINIFEKKDETGEDSVSNADAVKVFFFTYWLSVNYYKEEKTGKSAFFKTLVMNVYDHNTEIYDLVGGPELFEMTLNVMQTLLTVATTAEGPIKTVQPAYKTIYDQIMRTYREAAEEYKLKTPSAKKHENTSIAAMYPELTPESIAEDLAEIRLYEETTASNSEDGSDDPDADQTPEPEITTDEAAGNNMCGRGCSNAHHVSN